MKSDQSSNLVISVKRDVVEISKWPTDTISIDYCHQINESNKRIIIEPHTLILFVPGNPGCVGWYVAFLHSVVEKLGVGFSARGVSYAGHGVGEDIVGPDDLNLKDDDASHEKQRISWTIDGQVEHKIQWIDQIISSSMLDSNSNLKFIFIGHSIGCHLVQRLCVMRKDILSRTRNVIYLMPFTIFDPPIYFQKCYLNFGARTQKVALSILDVSSRLAKRIPLSILNFYLEKVAGVNDEEGREIALNLIISPAMARNFLSLGLEELRDVPQIPDDSALRIIGNQCKHSVLYCGTDASPDQWAPTKHIPMLKEYQKMGRIPETTSFTLIEQLQHDFVVHPEMQPPVVDFCVESISNSTSSQEKRTESFPKSKFIRSRL